MQYLQKIESWKNREQKLILKDAGQTFYISAKAAMLKADTAEKEIWQCMEGGHMFYMLRDKQE